jgi:hypothetical protein
MLCNWWWNSISFSLREVKGDNYRQKDRCNYGSSGMEMTRYSYESFALFFKKV